MYPIDSTDFLRFSSSLMATTTTVSKAENPKKTLAQSQVSDPVKKYSTGDQKHVPTTADASQQQQPPSSGGGGGEAKAVANAGTTSPVDNTVNGDDTPVTDIQKKIRRAERFGMPVQLSEEEKRNSRAERYLLFFSFMLIVCD